MFLFPYIIGWLSDKMWSWRNLFKPRYSSHYQEKSSHPRLYSMVDVANGAIPLQDYLYYCGYSRKRERSEKWRTTKFLKLKYFGGWSILPQRISHKSIYESNLITCIHTQSPQSPTATNTSFYWVLFYFYQGGGALVDTVLFLTNRVCVFMNLRRLPEI